MVRSPLGEIYPNLYEFRVGPPKTIIPGSQLTMVFPTVSPIRAPSAPTAPKSSTVRECQEHPVHDGVYQSWFIQFSNRS